MTKTLLLLPGDGIGSEVTAEVRRIVDALGLDVTLQEARFGGAAIDADGVPVTDETVALALAADAVLMGAVGGPKWAGQSFDTRPEAGLLRLREAMNVYANLRPARCFAALADASSLKRELVEGLDIMFVRELVGGVYFGKPRGIEMLANGERRGLNSHHYTTGQIRRVARTAFELAKGRTGRVCSVEKSNVMEAGLLWREEVQRLRDEDYPEIELTHMLADNCAMQLVRQPKQFDTILTDNLFGDMLSDEAAMLTGSLGLLPSAALGEAGRPGLYEPIHGSAPDIAGQGLANPSAAILSLAMAVRHSFGEERTAERIERAVETAIEGGTRTRDIGGGASTAEMGQAIAAAL
ncbi:3-isopropylmalate dehydrogenase [Pacificimonas flava]|uniref:3-isopropylmalate dehydrogenase n=1 Tax=Pacificimonas flava TaxID=1234595 RepID=M2T9C8_9SPHN|nr:3-isopropylmalate dehydrogenase [Pacificimonas flava]EMD83159.1 3-isopropylmalate dehydrogenase [Pacificimonas flava]MBB5279276.1 3-isopropylmalate dehydrogenase [Pacificimonas flava]